LARELEMCYVSLAMVTDYDVWAEHPVDVKTVLRTMSENLEKIRTLILAALPKIPKERDACDCYQALKSSGA